MNTSLSSVTRVYSGKPGCMCGCRGKWTDASAYAEAGSTVSDRSVKIMYNKVMNHPDVQLDAGANCAYVNTETRTLAVYFVGE